LVEGVVLKVIMIRWVEETEVVEALPAAMTRMVQVLQGKVLQGKDTMEEVLLAIVANTLEAVEGVLEVLEVMALEGTPPEGQVYLPI
jgi:redox-sensitive bicupin YhaK (pirin superfamily)